MTKYSKLSVGEKARIMGRMVELHSALDLSYVREIYEELQSMELRPTELDFLVEMLELFLSSWVPSYRAWRADFTVEELKEILCEIATVLGK